MYKVEIPNLDLMREAFAKSPQKIAPILIDAVKKAGAEIVNEEKKQAPVKTGNLRRAIELQTGNIYARITPTANYSSYVNFGTGIYGDRHDYIRPTRAKVLRFTIGGKVVYAKRTKGQRANDFIGRTLDAKISNINDIFNKATEQIVNEL